MRLLMLTLLVTASAVATAAHHGKILTNKAGMTLYTFDKDQRNESTCYDSCAAQWPPYLAAQGAEAKKGWKIIERNDGTKQWAYKGHPLYTWVGDTKQGDTTGDGVGGVWHTAEKNQKRKQEKVSGSPIY